MKDCDEFDMWVKNRLTKNDIYSAIFEGMTNGEVIKAIFPNIDKYNNMLLKNHSTNILFDEVWWNSPYEPQESEDKE